MGQVVQLFPNLRHCEEAEPTKQSMDCFAPLAMTRSRNDGKLEIFKKGLENGIVMITLDATREGVSVPSRFSKDFALSLNFSYRYNLPDFAFDEEGVSATLSFDEGYFYCLVPWEAVYRIGNEVWPEDFP